MKIAHIYFDGGWPIHNLEDALGGAERELISVAMLLSTKYETVFYGNIPNQFVIHSVQFMPYINQDDVIDADLVVSNNLGIIFNSRCKRYYYCWADRYNATDWQIPISSIDLVITDTQRGKQLFERLGCKSIVLYPLVRPDGFLTKRDPSRVLFVGRLSNNQKRPDLAIQAMNLVHGKTLHIIGSHRTENKAQSTFIQYCLDISNHRVIWRGELPYSELIKEYQSAELIIIPYCDDNEFNCNVALEAIANGCVPVIADGLVDYFHGDEGICLPKDLTPQMIADAITQVKDATPYRVKGWETASEIWEYCNGEMKEILLGA